MKSFRDVIADVPDFWMDGTGEDEKGEMLGVHNADRVVEALYAAGFVIIRDRTDPEGGIPGRI